MRPWQVFPDIEIPGSAYDRFRPSGGIGAVIDQLVKHGKIIKPLACDHGPIHEHFDYHIGVVIWRTIVVVKPVQIMIA